MDATAIELIQKTALAASLENRKLDTDTPTIILQHANGEQIVSLEQFGKGRQRLRGALTTSDLADFARYVVDNGNGQGFVNVADMSAKVFFNLGTVDAPGHADWTASLKLKPTAAFAALAAIDGQKMSQKDLADWLEDWNASLYAEYEKGDGTLARAVTAVRKLTIKTNASQTTSVTNVSASRSAMENIEAQSENDLPMGFSFVCEPYVGLSSRTFRLVISVLTGEDKPRLVLRWQQREATIEAIAREFKTVLDTSLGNAAVLTIGTFTP
jgi:uncharacterized protein YfdQ (DUF2303 family)